MNMDNLVTHVSCTTRFKLSEFLRTTDILSVKDCVIPNLHNNKIFQISKQNGFAQINSPSGKYALNARVVYNVNGDSNFTSSK